MICPYPALRCLWPGSAISKLIQKRACRQVAFTFTQTTQGRTSGFKPREPILSLLLGGSVPAFERGSLIRVAVIASVARSRARRAAQGWAISAMTLVDLMAILQ